MSSLFMSTKKIIDFIIDDVDLACDRVISRDLRAKDDIETLASEFIRKDEFTMNNLKIYGQPSVYNRILQIYPLGDYKKLLTLLAIEQKMNYSYDVFYYCEKRICSTSCGNGELLNAISKLHQQSLFDRNIGFYSFHEVDMIASIYQKHYYEEDYALMIIKAYCSLARHSDGAEKYRDLLIYSLTGLDAKAVERKSILYEISVDFKNIDSLINKINEIDSNIFLTSTPEHNTYKEYNLCKNNCELVNMTIDELDRLRTKLRCIHSEVYGIYMLNQPYLKNAKKNN